MRKFITQNKVTILFIFLLIFFGSLLFFSALCESLTFDEIVDLQEGRNAVVFHSFNIDPYNPPLTREIAVMPYIFSNSFYKSDDILLQNPIYARLTSIFFSLALLVSVFSFVKKYFGEKEALLSSLLLALEPNILTNSHYITMDIGLTFFVFLSFFLFIRLTQQATVKNALLLSSVVGLGLVTKISFIPYFFLSALIVSLMKYKFKLILKIREKGKLAIIGWVCALFIIWASYFFTMNVVIKPRQDNSRVSVKVLQYAKQHNLGVISNTVSFLENQSLPLGDYLATLKNNVLRSLHSDKCFFLGKFYSSCQWYFMLVNLFIKNPIPLFVLFAMSVYAFLAKKKKDKTILYMLVCVVVILGTAMFMRITPLIRYVLPLFPFLVIVASCSIAFWRKSFFRKIIFAALIVWYICGTLSSFPHFISYANELSFGKKIFLLTDSNMDWGQSLPDVKDFALHNPSFTFSYFGRDNGNLYGLKSVTPYGSYKTNEICAFHQVGTTQVTHPILISVSNWYMCGYNKVPKFTKDNIKEIIGSSILVF